MDGSTGPLEYRGDLHRDYGAVLTEDETAIEHYGRPERTVKAVRNGVGIRDRPADVIVVRGSDRIEYVDNVVTGSVTDTAGEVTYSFLLDPDGTISAELTIYTADDRLVILTPPGTGSEIVDSWEVFVQDVTINESGDEFAVFGVHGPTATEKLATLIRGTQPPAEPWTFNRGEIAESGVILAQIDAPTGEEGYEIIVEGADGERVLNALFALGPGAVPIGQWPWETLTLEAGTPLFRTELLDRLPNVVGARTAVDYEKGCFVGQEVVSRIENRGRTPERLHGFVCATVPDPGTDIRSDESVVGTITRAVHSPTLEHPIAFGMLDATASQEADYAVRLDEGIEPVTITELPFADTPYRSGRLPQYPDQ